FCFFFQAEDGIRDFHVTGVQTCALPICRTDFAFWGHLAGLLAFWVALGILALDDQVAPAAFAAVSAGLVALSAFLMRRLYAVFRSEERRVGKGRRSRVAVYHVKEIKLCR